MTAQEAVFDSYELQEQILLRLPVPDLLFSSRVCHTWRSLIRRSVSIRDLLVQWKQSDYDDWRRHPIPPTSIAFHTDTNLGTIFTARRDRDHVFVFMRSPTKPLTFLHLTKNELDSCCRVLRYSAEMKCVGHDGGRVLNRTFPTYKSGAPYMLDYVKTFIGKAWGGDSVNEGAGVDSEGMVSAAKAV